MYWFVPLRWSSMYVFIALQHMKRWRHAVVDIGHSSLTDVPCEPQLGSRAPTRKPLQATLLNMIDPYQIQIVLTAGFVNLKTFQEIARMESVWVPIIWFNKKCFNASLACFILWYSLAKIVAIKMHVCLGHRLDGTLRFGAIVGSNGYWAIGSFTNLRRLQRIHGLDVPSMAPQFEACFHLPRIPSAAPKVWLEEFLEQKFLDTLSCINDGIWSMFIILAISCIFTFSQLPHRDAQWGCFW